MEYKDSGVLFKNDRKSKDSDPDYKGSIVIDGKDNWLNCWLNESSRGVKYMSLKWSPKGDVPNVYNEREMAKNPPQSPSGYEDFDDDSIPF